MSLLNRIKQGEYKGDLSTIIAIAVFGIGCSSLTYYIAKKPPKVTPAVKTVIAEAFPNTDFSRIAYDEKVGMLSAEAGENIFYFSEDTNRVFVGEVLDLKNRVNLTEQRRQELASVLDFEALASGQKRDAKAQAAPSQRNAEAQRPPAPSTVDFSSLTEENYVVKNEGAGRVLYVVSDYNCGFCKKLYNTLNAITDIEIREIPVAILGQESQIKAASVLCADNPAQAASDFFTGAAGAQITTCSDGEQAVSKNTQWMQEVGQTGTPFMFTEDGRVLNGARSLDIIRSFLSS